MSSDREPDPKDDGLALSQTIRQLSQAERLRLLQELSISVQQDISVGRVSDPTDDSSADATPTEAPFARRQSQAKKSDTVDDQPVTTGGADSEAQSGLAIFLANLNLVDVFQKISLVAILIVLYFVSPFSKPKEQVVRRDYVVILNNACGVIEESYVLGVYPDGYTSYFFNGRANLKLDPDQDNYIVIRPSPRFPDFDLDPIRVDIKEPFTSVRVEC